MCADQHRSQSTLFKVLLARLSIGGLAYNGRGGYEVESGVHGEMGVRVHQGSSRKVKVSHIISYHSDLQQLDLPRQVGKLKPHVGALDSQPASTPRRRQ